MTKKPTKATTAPASDKPVANGHRDYYRTGALANWQADKSGPAPALAAFDTVHAIAKKRPGVEALHVAMCLRPQGCTVREFRWAGRDNDGMPCGPANNYRGALVTVDKVITVNVLPGQGREYRFKAVLTAKGAALCKAAGVTPPKGALASDAASDKPAKVKRARKPKATPAPQLEAAPTSDAPQA